LFVDTRSGNRLYLTTISTCRLAGAGLGDRLLIAGEHRATEVFRLLVKLFEAWLLGQWYCGDVGHDGSFGN
jgi:hypothetical protein